MYKISKSLFKVLMIVISFMAVSCGGNAVALTQYVDITVLESAEVQGNKIFLGDLATIKGDDAELVNRIKNIFMGKSPLPGSSRRFDNNYLSIRLKQSDIDISRVRISGAEQTSILRGSNKVTKEQIEKMVRGSLPSLFPFENDQINIKSITVSDEAILPNGDFTYKVVPPKNTDFLGNVPLSVFLYVDGEFQKRIYATLDVELITEVVVAKRSLKRNQTVTDLDIGVVRRDLADVPSNAIIDPEEVLGKKLTQSVNADTVLRKDLIDMPPMVGRKDIVMMIAENDHFRITAVGESQEKGKQGQRIRVVNLDSRKEVYARVIDANTVKIDN